MALEPAVQSAAREVDEFIPATRVALRGQADAGDSDPGFGLAEIKRALGRHKGLIAACIVVVTLTAAIVLPFLPKEYVAEAMLSIEHQKTEIADIQSIVMRGFSENMQVTSEAELLRAPDLAARVVDKLNLTQNKEFIGPLEPQPWLRRLMPSAWLAAADDLLPSELLDAVGLKAPKALDPTALRTAVANELLQRLTVVSDPHSYVLKIRMRSHDAELAASLANAYAEAYLASQENSKEQVGQHASAWLTPRLEELRTRAGEAEQAAEDFRAKHNLLTIDGSRLTLVSQQLRELNAQLAAATADRAAKEADMSRIKAAVNSGGGVAALSNVLASPLIQKLGEQESVLKGRKESIANRFLPDYPDMKQLQAELAEVQSNAAKETQKIVTSLSTDLAGARAREDNLRTRIASLISDYNRDSAADMDLRKLQQEADASRKLYQQFLDRYNAVSAQTGGEAPDARIVSAAHIPDFAAFPRQKLMLGAAFLGSALFGAGLALLMELFDKGVRTERQIEAITGVPAAGLVPAIRSQAVDTVMTQRGSPYSEAIRNIGVSLRMAAAKVVLVTSAMPGEGKSVFAASLACSVADDGHRVLLVDCDLRRPTVHRMVKEAPRAGIRDLVLGEVAEDAAVGHDAATGIAYILGICRSRSLKPSPQDLFGSSAFERLLTGWRDQYDLVILDAPPVLSVSDPLILSRLADNTLLVVHWASTPLAIFEAAVRKLRATTDHALRVVLSRVDLRTYAQYEFGKGYQDVYTRNYGAGVS